MRWVTKNLLQAPPSFKNAKPLAPATFTLLHLHQPINVPTAEAQGFLTDYLQGEGAITNHANPLRYPWWCWWVLTTTNTAETNGNVSSEDIYLKKGPSWDG
jgi:hypothetical protein